MDLTPISGSGCALTVPLGHVLVFGRQPQFHLTSPRISRTHVTLSASLGYDGSPQLLVAAHKRCWLRRPDGTTQELQPQQTAEVNVGLAASRGLHDTPFPPLWSTQSMHHHLLSLHAQALPGDVLYLTKEGTELGAGFACAPAAKGRPHPTTQQQHQVRLQLLVSALAMHCMLSVRLSCATGPDCGVFVQLCLACARRTMQLGHAAHVPAAEPPLMHGAGPILLCLPACRQCGHPSAKRSAPQLLQLQVQQLCHQQEPNHTQHQQQQQHLPRHNRARYAAAAAGPLRTFPCPACRQTSRPSFRAAAWCSHPAARRHLGCSSAPATWAQQSRRI